jgi:hypothetical protein
MKLCEKWQERMSTLQKHQSPSTKFQTIPKFQFRMTQTEFISEFGHLMIENNLEFGYWNFHACLAPAILG